MCLSDDIYKYRCLQRQFNICPYFGLSDAHSHTSGGETPRLLRQMWFGYRFATGQKARQRRNEADRQPVELTTSSHSYKIRVLMRALCIMGLINCPMTLQVVPVVLLLGNFRFVRPRDFVVEDKQLQTR